MTIAQVLHNGVVSTDVSVLVLGRVAVEVDDAPIDLRGGLPPAIIARLAMSGGEQVPVERFIADLWWEPPTSAAVTLRANMSRLRAAGLADVIQGGRGGYTFARDVRVDALEFLAAARTARDRPALEAAVALWGGDPLAGVDAPFAAEHRAVLLEAWRRVALELARMQLDAGEVDSALRALPALVRDNPVHEEPVRLLAMALARAGRTPEALETIDGFTRRLTESQGLDPSAALAETRMSIVRQDPTLAPARARARQHGVPLPLTRFVGRRDELARIAEARRAARLVTITGPGGAGKSRLAVESLRAAAGDGTDDEQWLLEMASLPTGRDVLTALAELVAAATPTVEAAAEALSGRGTLLVLDNAEHILDEVAALAVDLLAASPGLAILVTSREPLRVPGERLVPVSMMLGDAAPDGLALFAERAADAHPGFSLDDSTRPLARRIVELVDGLPLALELAAARLDVMDLTELARSLESSELLAVGTATGRHGNLQAVIDWSARLLTPPQLELLAQLGNFAGAVTLDAIAGICVLDDADVRSTALALAQKSLLAVAGTGSSRRYRLLESVKFYARRLDSRDDRGRWRERHARWFADRVDELERRIRGVDSFAAHREFDLERAELIAAMQTVIERGDRPTAVRLVGGQGWHWFIRGALPEYKQWIDDALDLPGDVDPYFDARAIWGAVMIIYRSGDKFGGEAYAKRGLPLAREAGDPTLLALFLACNAMWMSELDQPGAHRVMAEVESILAEGAVAPWVPAEVLTFRSIIWIYAKKPANTIADLQAALESARLSHNWWAGLSAAWRLAHTFIRLRRDRDAIDQLLWCFSALEGHDDVLGTILAVHAGAIALIGVERQTDAARLFASVDRLGALYGFPRSAVNDEDHERHRDRAKQALTTAEWNAAYREGATFSLDEAVAHFRRVARALPPRR